MEGERGIGHAGVVQYGGCQIQGRPDPLIVFVSVVETVDQDLKYFSKWKGCVNASSNVPPPIDHLSAEPDESLLVLGKFFQVVDGQLLVDSGDVT